MNFTELHQGKLRNTQSSSEDCRRRSAMVHQVLANAISFGYGRKRRSESNQMQCPRCESKRIQRDYDNANPVIRLIGLRKVLCNNCGLVFRRFDPLNKVRRTPTKREYKSVNRRRGPRYRAHLPAAISLIERLPEEGKATYSEFSNGHCETISKFGMGVSLVGTRLPEKELTRIGGVLFLRITLPASTIEAVVSIVNHHRFGEDEKRKWFLGVKIIKITEPSKSNLDAYLEKRGRTAPLILSD